MLSGGFGVFKSFQTPPVGGYWCFLILFIFVVETSCGFGEGTEHLEVFARVYECQTKKVDSSGSCWCDYFIMVMS